MHWTIRAWCFVIVSDKCVERTSEQPSVVAIMIMGLVDVYQTPWHLIVAYVCIEIQMLSTENNNNVVGNKIIAYILMRRIETILCYRKCVYVTIKYSNMDACELSVFLFYFFSVRAFKLTIDDGLRCVILAAIYNDMTNQTHHESNLLSQETTKTKPSASNSYPIYWFNYNQTLFMGKCHMRI